jgi:hypothetical protein
MSAITGGEVGGEAVNIALDGPKRHSALFRPLEGY